MSLIARVPEHINRMKSLYGFIRDVKKIRYSKKSLKGSLKERKKEIKYFLKFFHSGENVQIS